MPDSVVSKLRFGPFVLDARAGRLTRGGTVVPIERKPLAVLRLLAEANGELVTRGRIAETVWPGAPFPEVEGYVNTAIRKVRAALDDDPRRPRYIQTFRGCGYRFLAPVEPATSRYRHPRSIVRAAYAAAFALALGAGIASFYGRSGVSSVSPRTGTVNEPYLRALALVSRANSIAGLRRARAGVSAAVAARPDFLPARELAARTELGLWRATEDAFHAETAAAMALQALDLDDRSGVALAVTGALAYFRDWNESAAEDMFQRALEIAGDDDYVLHEAAWFELARGRTQRAYTLMHRVLDRAPLSPALHTDLGWFLFRGGDYAGALAACSALGSDEPFPGARECRHRALVRLGRFEEAMAEFGLEAGASPTVAYQRFASAQAQSAHARGSRSSCQAYLWAAAGRRSEALDALRQAVSEGGPWVQLTRTTPEFAILRGEPGYEALLDTLAGPRIAASPRANHAAGVEPVSHGTVPPTLSSLRAALTRRVW